MPYGHMDIAELARFLGLDQRRLMKMAQRDEIPCRKIQGQLRFNRAEITEWLQQTMGNLPHTHLTNMDAGITAHRQSEPGEALIAPMLHPNTISTCLAARTKNSVLRELCALAQESEHLYDPEELLETLIQREELCSTAMEAGIAIPHPRRPLPYAIAEPILVIANTPQGIGFGAPDGRLTDLFFMTCSKDDRHHLHVLARLCRMLNDTNFVRDLREASSPGQVIQLMIQREKALISDTA